MEKASSFSYHQPPVESSEKPGICHLQFVGLCHETDGYWSWNEGGHGKPGHVTTDTLT